MGMCQRCCCLSSFWSKFSHFKMMKLAVICLIAFAAVEGTSEDAAASLIEVRTVAEDLNGSEGIMRSLNTEGSENAAEDRFCFPPATPTCTQYQVECNNACAALTPTYDTTKSCRITARRCIWSVYRDCNCSLFGSTTTTTTTPATTPCVNVDPCVTATTDCCPDTPNCNTVGGVASCAA